MLKKYVPLKLKCILTDSIDILMVSYEVFDNDIADKTWDLGGVGK